MVSGEEFKTSLKAGDLKLGLFLNAASPPLAGQFSHSGYDWLLIDMQHGPMDYCTLGFMISAIANGKAKSMVRVASAQDRPSIQQALDLGADGILIPYINTAAELKEAVAICRYPEPPHVEGTRSIGYLQPSANECGPVEYLMKANKNVIIAFQVETAECIKNIEEIMAVDGIDIAFLGQSDLSMTMGLWQKYKFPDMYSSPELKEAQEKMVKEAKKRNVSLGIFLFGTARVKEFYDQGFNFISLGNDLHHALTQTETHVKKVEEIMGESGKPWKRQKTALF